MKLSRRVAHGTSQLVVDGPTGLVELSALPAAQRAQLAWLEPLAPELAESSPGVLPLQPRSFRDCLLFERHWVQASRGYARRFMPRSHTAATMVERITGRPFRAFLPPALSARQPLYYFGNHLTFVPSGTPVHAPPYTRALDYELELGLVLARPLRDAEPEEALAAIGGFVVVNDWTARDVQRAEMASGFGPQKAKHFQSAMSCTLVTADEILPHIDSLEAHVEINGRRVARCSTRGLMFDLGRVLAHLSCGEQLYPGELIATGTLPDGSGMENGHWVSPGDTLRLVFDAIGEIEQRIV